MKKTIDELMVELGNDFRGLWTSCEIGKDGRIKKGWSVTFVYEIHMVETPYQKTPYDALKFAIDLKRNWNLDFI